MAHVAAARLVNARKAKIARILDGVGLLAAQKLHQHGIEQLCTGANHDSLGVNIHSARTLRKCAAIARRRRAVPSRRRQRKQFALVLARKHRLQRAPPKASTIERRFWQVGYPAAKARPGATLPASRSATSLSRGTVRRPR